MAAWLAAQVLGLSFSMPNVARVCLQLVPLPRNRSKCLLLFDNAWRRSVRARSVAPVADAAPSLVHRRGLARRDAQLAAPLSHLCAQRYMAAAHGARPCIDLAHSHSASQNGKAAVASYVVQCRRHCELSCVGISMRTFTLQRRQHAGASTASCYVGST